MNTIRPLQFNLPLLAGPGTIVTAMTYDQQAEAGEFLQALDEHDDVHPVWAAVK